MTEFCRDELEFYQRHITLSMIGEEGQKRLKNASVLVVGAGGLGCPALLYLTAAGVGRIGIIDDDIVETSNLQRQILFKQNDVGKQKAETAYLSLSQNNPHIHFDFYNERLNPENAEKVLSEYSIIIDGSDNFQTKYLLNDACLMFNKVLIYGSIYEFSGQISVFNFENGPTYRCLFPEVSKNDPAGSCAEVGVIGALPGVIGSLQATEAIKVITGVGQVLSGKLLLYNALNQETKLLTFSKNHDLRPPRELSLEDISCIKQIQHGESKITAIESDDLKKMMQKGSLDLMIDVREGWERSIERIDPSIHIPLGNFENPTQVILPEKISKDSKILLYCKAGVRSLHACQIMESMGFENLFNLEGGMTEWTQNSASS